LEAETFSERELLLFKTTSLGWDVARWYRACLACLRPWVPTHHQKKKKKKKEKDKTTSLR
jgi:hypothetical protein